MASFPTVSPGGRPINESPLGKGGKGNWVSKRGGLPPYIRGVARGVDKANPNSPRAIKIAIGRMRKWAATSKNPAVRAASAEAIARWDAMKGTANKGRRR